VGEHLIVRPEFKPPYSKNNNNNEVHKIVFWGDRETRKNRDEFDQSLFYGNITVKPLCKINVY
jgi:hypothetical protein